MAQIIYKYPIVLDDDMHRGVLKLPKHAHMLKDYVQHKSFSSPIYIYAIVDPDETELVDVDVMIYGTGQLMDDMSPDYTYFTSWEIDGVVLHVFIKF